MSEQTPSKRIWPPDPAAGGGEVKPAPEGDKARPVGEKIVDAIRKVYDPEIPINIYDLGLVYNIDWNEQTRRVRVRMTLTTPNCPEAESLPGMVRAEIERIPEVACAEVDIVWDPPWDKSKMSDEAKLILGIE